jgi:hypothetical protein
MRALMQLLQPMQQPPSQKLHDRTGTTDAVQTYGITGTSRPRICIISG